jgi:ubiquinone/menaquinone biosynthesis C-methylase UbiE
MRSSKDDHLKKQGVPMSNPGQDYSNTYFVQDRSNEDELARLQIIDQMITAGMGGVLPEQADLSRFQRVLDVGCGTGGWLIELARQSPQTARLVGVDASKRIVTYAREQASTQQMSERVQFQAMDALFTLPFPDYSFDLVTHRFAMSWLRTWEWSRLLQEYLRVCKPGGVIRVTESDFLTESSSPALLRLWQIAFQAFWQSGHFFVAEPDGVTCQLAQLMQQEGLENVQTRAYELHYRAGAQEADLFTENTRLGFRTALPFYRKWMRLPDDYEAIYQQALAEMLQPDFTATLRLLTVWGTSLGYSRDVFSEG